MNERSSFITGITAIAAHYLRLVSTPRATKAEIAAAVGRIAQKGRGLLRELTPPKPTRPEWYKPPNPLPIKIDGDLNGYTEGYLKSKLDLDKVFSIVIHLTVVCEEAQRDLNRTERASTSEFEAFAWLVSASRRFFIKSASEDKKRERGAETRFVECILTYIPECGSHEDIRRSRAWLRPKDACPWKSRQTFREFLCEE